MKFHIGHLLGLSAVILAISAAFFSVTGLGQLFAGASIAVIIMASALEFSKIVIATFLHKYWSQMAKALRIYLTIGVVVLVLITSAGIYGFLSSAYQQTATELGMHDSKVGLIDSKIALVEKKVDDNTKLIDSKLERYNNLMTLRKVQEVRLDSMINRKYFSNANKTRDEIEIASNEMVVLQSNVDVINIQNSKLNDSIAKYELSKMEMIASSSIVGEVGPLKYLAELTDQPMDVIVNYFTLLLIFVFDPLAISLVVATNWVFDRKRDELKVKKVKPKTKPVMDPITGEIDLKYDSTHIEQDVYLSTYGEPEEEVVVDDYNDGEAGPDAHDIDINDVEVVEHEVVEAPVVEEVIEEVKVEEPVIEEPTTRKKLSIEDLETVGVYSKGSRGFSTKIPEPKISTERRIGTNKILKDENQMIYKKRNDTDEKG